MVDRPLSDYLRYELAVYAENVAAGEDVLIADRSIHPDLEALNEDFAIFDTETVILFDYDDGLVRGYRITDDRQTVDRYRERYDLAVTRSVPSSTSWQRACACEAFDETVADTRGGGSRCHRDRQRGLPDDE